MTILGRVQYGVCWSLTSGVDVKVKQQMRWEDMEENMSYTRKIKAVLQMLITYVLLEWDRSNREGQSVPSINLIESRAELLQQIAVEDGPL